MATDIVGRAADPARHRRRADLRPQLRRPVPARPRRPGSSAGIWQAGDRGRRGAVLRASSSCCWSGSAPAQVISGDLTVGQLISFLGYALFMIYPIQTFFELAQKSPGRWSRRARRSRSSSSSRRGPTGREHAAAARTPTCTTSVTGFVARRRRADDRGVRRARGHGRARRPARPLPAGRHRAGQPGARGGHQGPRGPPGPGGQRLAERAAARRARRGAGQPRVGRHARRRRPRRAPRSTTYAGRSWSATPAASSSPAPCRTPSTRTAG